MFDVKQVGEWLKWAVSVGVAIVAIFKFLQVVVKKINENDQRCLTENKRELSEIKEMLQGLVRKMTTLNEATGLVLRQRIEGNFLYLQSKKECTLKEKKDLLKLIKQYKDLGFNHINDGFMEDVKRLRVCSYASDEE